MQKIYFVTITLLLVFSCSNKHKNLEQACSNDSDCLTDNICVESFCEQGFCKNTNKEDNTVCDNTNVCYGGDCKIAMGSCTSNSDCLLSLNPCLEGVCSKNLCIYTNKDEGESCAEKKVCIDGYCSGPCFSDLDCDDNNACTSSVCNNIVSTSNLSKESMITHDGLNWWILDSTNKKVLKFDSSWNYLNFSFFVDLSGFFPPHIFVKNNYIYIQDSFLIKIYSSSGILDRTVNLKTDSNIPDEISGVNGYKNLTSNNFFYDGTYWWVFGTYSNSSNANGGAILINGVYQLDSNFIYLNYFPLQHAAKRVFFDGNNWFISSDTNPSIFIIHKYDAVFTDTGISYDISITGSIKNSFFLVNDTWFVPSYKSLNDQKIFKFNKDFEIKSYCKYSSLASGTSCEGNKYCSNGFCSECSNASHCNDGNVCTADICSFGMCQNENKANGTDCSINSSQRYCSNGICILGNCSVDTDCPADTSCRDNFCNLNNFMCSWTAIQEKQYCSFPEPPVGTPPVDHLYLNYLLSIQYNIFSCNTGTCSFNPINIGLCDTPFVNTGTVHALIINRSARVLNNEQVVLAVAGKFNDSGLHKCAGYNTIFIGYGTVFPIFADDYATPEKEGFIYGEPINLYIRTNNYVCQVKANYDTTTGYPSTDRWGPLGMSNIVKFKDMNGEANINFTNTTYCTPIN